MYCSRASRQCQGIFYVHSGPTVKIYWVEAVNMTSITFIGGRYLESSIIVITRFGYPRILGEPNKPECIVGHGSRLRATGRVVGHGQGHAQSQASAATLEQLVSGAALVSGVTLVGGHFDIY